MRYFHRFIRATEKYDTQVAMIMCIIIMAWMSHYGSDFFALIGATSVVCVGAVIFLLCMTMFRPGLTRFLKAVDGAITLFIHKRHNRNVK